MLGGWISSQSALQRHNSRSAKTPKQVGVAKDFDITIRDFVINGGSEMIVAIAGDMMRMPGLPKVHKL